MLQNTKKTNLIVGAYHTIKRLTRAEEEEILQEIEQDEVLYCLTSPLQTYSLPLFI